MVYIKSIELCGFKTFHDRVTAEFWQGINCITGPGGSGKTNLINAIKWVLEPNNSEFSESKGLGILSIGEDNTQAEFAEVSLTIGYESDSEFEQKDFSIGRVLTQNGLNSYYINGKQIEAAKFLQFVNELNQNFLDTFEPDRQGDSSASSLQLQTIESLIQFSMKNDTIPASALIVDSTEFALSDDVLSALKEFLVKAKDISQILLITHNPELIKLADKILRLSMGGRQGSSGIY